MVDRICDNCMSRVPANADKCPRCGIRFENTNPGGALPNGWVLGERYTVGRYIEIDGEGVTYSAIDANSFQRVIIKEFMPVTLCAARDDRGAIVPKPGCEVLFKTTRMDFSEMYGVLVTLGRTEGLVSVLDVLEENNTAYAILEKIEGPTLAEYMVRQEYPIEPQRALAILRPIMLGVEALHNVGVVHRGVSPDNIILESGGTAKLGGYATLALRQQGSELKPKLYAGYSAPEQYTASEFEGRYTDIYALGATLYSMITGEEPMPADERRMQDTMPPARVVDKEVPAFLSTGIARAMRLEQEERIQNISDLRLAFSGEGPRNSGPKGKGGKKEEKGLFGLTKQQTIVGGIALGAVLILLIVVILIIALGGGNKPASSSSSQSLSVVSALPGEVPSFVGKLYTEVVNDKSNKEEYVFGTPVEQYDDDVEKGYIISQTPVAGTEYDGETPIIFVVSKGREPVELPDFAAQGKTQAEAELELTRLDIEYEVISQANDGTYTPGAVIKTDPAAGTKVVPGENKVLVYVAGEQATIAMPNVVGQTQDAAISILRGSGIDESRIKVSTSKAPNDGTKVAGTVATTDPAPGTQISTGSVTVTLTVYDNFYMPDLSSYVGKDKSELTAWLDAHKIYFSYTIETVENPGDKREGEIAGVSGPATNAVVSQGTNIVIRVYGAPAAASTPPP